MKKFCYKTPSCPIDFVIPQAKLWLRLHNMHRIFFTNMVEETFVPEQPTLFQASCLYYSK